MKRSATKLGAAVALTLVLSGCSPSALFGNQKDRGVQNQKTYRQINVACSRMNLSSARLDVTSSRALIDCLDSRGALGDFAQLVRSMKDEELAPFVMSINRSVLDNPGTLFKFQRILDDLNERGELDTMFASIEKLLQQDELIAHSVSIFRKSYAPEGKIDRTLLKAAQRLSHELTTEHVADGLDLGLVTARAAALRSAWDRLKGGDDLDPQVAEGLAAYGKSPSAVGRELIDHLLDGSMFEYLDQIVPTDASGILEQTPRWASVLDHSLADRGVIASNLGGLFGALSQPIPCMQGARALRYSPMDVIGEMTALPNNQVRAFIGRDKLAQLYVAYPLCSFPPQAAAGYQSMVRLADTAAIEPLSDLLRTAYQLNRGGQRVVADFLIRSLGDPGFQSLVPALAEIEKKDGWKDLLLLATSPIVDRSKMTYALQVLVDPINARGVTVYDVLVQGFARVDAAELHAWLKSFKHSSSSLSIADALSGMRAAFYVNDAHPLLDLAREALADAPTDPALIEATLKASGHKEFQGAIRSLGEMSGDGRLKDLLLATLTLFERYAAKGQTTVNALAPGQAAPSMRFAVRHNFAAGNLTEWQLSEPMGDFGVCSNVDFSKPWNDLSRADAESQLNTVSSCVNSDGQYKAIADSLTLLANEKTDTSAPRSLYRVLVDAYNSFSFTRNEAAILSDWMLGAVRDGRVLRTLKALPILIHESVVKPLVDFAEPLISDVNARLGLKRLGVYGSNVLRRADLQQIVAHVDDLYREHPKRAKAVKRAPYDRQRVLRWISNKECSSLPPSSGPGSDPALDSAKGQRLAQILNEYENAVVNDGARASGGGKLRESWTTDELKNELAPIFKKFADIPGNGPLARTLTRFAGRFADLTQYPPGYLETWLRKRANDRRLISYFYPGEKVPRVRLVNGLDVLSLILMNADFTDIPNLSEMESMVLGTVGMQYLSEIAVAWGDVPFEKRPEPIQKKYPQNKHCPTLAEAIDGIQSSAWASIQTFGLHALPKCQQLADPNDSPEVQKAETTDPVRPPATEEYPYADEPAPGTETETRELIQAKLSNVAQTIAILKENVDNGGMQVLRDLFYDLYFTGPKINQEPDAGLKNNLSVVFKLVQTGLLRQVGQRIADTPENDPVIHAFFATLTEGAASPEIGTVAENLFSSTPNQELLWNIIDQVVSLKSPQDIALAKSVGLHSLAALHTLEDALKTSQMTRQTSTPAPESRTTLATPMLDSLLRTLQPIFAKHGALLARHTDLVGDLITWSDGADFLRALSISSASLNANATNASLASLIADATSDTQRGMDLMAMLNTLDASPKADQAWTDFRDRWKALDQNAEFRSLHLSDIGRDVLNTIEGRDASGRPLSADQIALSRKLLTTIAAAGERGDFEVVDQLLALAARKPNEFYRLLEAVSQLVEHGEIPRLLELIDSKLGKPVQN